MFSCRLPKGSRVSLTACGKGATLDDLMARRARPRDGPAANRARPATKHVYVHMYMYVYIYIYIHTYTLVCYVLYTSYIERLMFHEYQYMYELCVLRDHRRQCVCIIIMPTSGGLEDGLQRRLGGAGPGVEPVDDVAELHDHLDIGLPRRGLGRAAKRADVARERLQRCTLRRAMACSGMAWNGTLCAPYQIAPDQIGPDRTAPDQIRPGQA